MLKVNHLDGFYNSGGKFTTWDEGKKNSNITISSAPWGPNLTAAASNLGSSQWVTVVANRGALGKRYFEIRTASGTYYVLGIFAVNNGFSIADGTFPGSPTYGVGWYNIAGQIYVGGTPTAYGGAGGGLSGDVVGIAVDPPANQITFILNGTSLGAFSVGLTQDNWAAAAVNRYDGSTAQLRTQRYQFTQSIPSGFLAYDD